MRRSVINGYRDEISTHSDTVPLTSLKPVPDFATVAKASRAHAIRLENGADLPAALKHAIEIIRNERRQVLLDLSCAVSDAH